jgi:hypothetical protein
MIMSIYSSETSDNTKPMSASRPATLMVIWLSRTFPGKESAPVKFDYLSVKVLKQVIAEQSAGSSCLQNLCIQHIIRSSEDITIQ